VQLTRQLVCGLLARDGRALLVHRSPSREVYPGVWDFPGGHVEPGEAPVAALVRELAEELGVIVAAPVDDADLVLDGDGWHLSVWIVRAWDGEVRNLQPDEHDVLSWFTLDEALALDFADPEYRDLLRAALA
jgi:mutator protein MutT